MYRGHKTCATVVLTLIGSGIINQLPSFNGEKKLKTVSLDKVREAKIISCGRYACLYMSALAEVKRT